MTLMFLLFMAATCAELTLYIPGAWRIRKVSVVLAMILMFTALGLTTTVLIWFALPPLVAVCLYRLLNLYRILEGIAVEPRLKVTSRKTVLWLNGFTWLLLGLAVLAPKDTTFIHVLVAAAVFIAALAMWLITRRSQILMAFPKIQLHTPGRDLPTITVAIPARNETDDLEACLHSLIASSYSKLEILVLDDCSQNKRTPEIIRNFAHDGVRFIPGKTPPDTWLAKNHAYDQLLDAANGSIVIFCGVDARFNPATITQLVETMIHKERDMISVVPINTVPNSHVRGMLIQPLRYAWEMSLPRNWRKNPPVLSTCWAIKKEALYKLGGMAAVKRSILPERFFARQLSTHKSYGFYLSSHALGLYCRKQVDEQYDTAVRVRYPQLHQRMELVAALSFCQLIFVIGPFIGLILALITSSFALALLSALTIVVTAFWFAMMVSTAYRKMYSLAALLYPVALIYDIYLMNVSLWRYEFTQVIWKGRNICIPMMRVYPALPKIK